MSLRINSRSTLITAEYPALPAVKVKPSSTLDGRVSLTGPSTSSLKKDIHRPWGNSRKWTDVVSSSNSSSNKIGNTQTSSRIASSASLRASSLDQALREQCIPHKWAIPLPSSYSSSSSSTPPDVRICAIASSSSFGPSSSSSTTSDHSEPITYTTKNIWINNRFQDLKADLKAGNATSWADLCKTEFENFNLINCTTALHTVAVNYRGNVELFKDKHRAIINWLLSKIENKISSSSIDTRSISNLFHSCAALEINLEKEHPSIFATISEAAIKKISHFTARDLAETAQSLAKLGIRNETLINAIAEAFQTIIENDRQTVISGPVQMIRTQYNPLDLVTIARAFAELGIRNSPLINAIAAAVQRKIDNFTPRDLAMIFSIFVKLGIYNPIFINAIASAAQRRIGDFNARDLCSFAVTYAKLYKLDIKNEPFMKAVATAARLKIRDFNPLDLTLTCFAYNQMRLDNKKLFESVRVELLRKDDHGNRKIDNCRIEGLDQLAASLANLRIESRDLLVAIESAIRKNIANISTEDLALIGRNIAVYTNILSSPSSKEIGYKFLIYILKVIATRKNTLSEKACSQIQAIFIFLKIVEQKHHISIINESLKPLDEQTLKVINVSDAPHSSITHQRVHSVLQKIMKHSLKNEFRVHIFFVDIVASVARKFGIEIEGPCHYLKSGAESGDSLFRTLILKFLGWTIITVKATDWDLLKTEKDQKSYLMSLIPPEFQYLLKDEKIEVDAETASSFLSRAQVGIARTASA